MPPRRIRSSQGTAPVHPPQLEPAALRRLAGKQSYERGEDYFASGRVGPLAIDGDVVVATVQGNHEYRVQLELDGDDLDYDCSCPVGEDGDFCKHTVAVALVWRDHWTSRKTGSPSERSTQASTPTMDDLRAYLLAREKTELVELLVGHAMEDEPLREALFLRLARERAGGPDLRAIRAAMRRAIRVGEFVDYAGSFDYARGLGRIATELEELLDEGHAHAVVELCEEALAELEDAIEHVDDSSGAVGSALGLLQKLHFEACVVARPDPASLARRLFMRETSSEWDIFAGAASAYSEVLGQRGLAVYRQLAEAVWAKVPPLQPGDSASGAWDNRYRITRIMEDLTDEAGDLEAQVAVRSRDLSLPYGFLKAAELYREGGEYDRALEWAERGVAAFPDRRDPRLVGFLLEEYHRRGRFDEVMERVWQEFVRSPVLESYRVLKQHAERIGGWDRWRERAISYLREQIAIRKSQPSSGSRFARPVTHDHSEVVRIFLRESDTEAAWQEAREGGCSEALWLQLAALREADHPEDAVPIYLRQIEPILAGANRRAYGEAVQVLGRIRTLQERIGRNHEFRAYLVELRARHRRKRVLMDMLDRAESAARRVAERSP